MIAVLLSLLVGCADPLADAQKANTIESWEAYLATNPDGSDKTLAETSLATLLIEKARKDKTPEAYDAVINRFPKHKEIKALKEERINVAFLAAEASGTADAWKKFLEENKDASKSQKERARGMVSILEYNGLQQSDVVMEEVNLAEDPKGPKDGWGFKVKFTNTGAKEIEYMNVEIRYLDDKGLQISTEKWPLVAQVGPGGVPVLEETTKPLKPGETREWFFTTGNIPTNWAKQVKVYPISVRFTGTAANEGPQDDKKEEKK